MTEDDVAVISSNGQLTLTLVSRDHEGEWRCQATNSSGSTEARTRLIVTPGKGMYIPYRPKFWRGQTLANLAN